MIDVNIKGLLYGVAAVLPIMQKQKQGHILNIASVASFKVFAPGGTVYSATKFAVRAVTEGLRMAHRLTTFAAPWSLLALLPRSSRNAAPRKRTERICVSSTNWLFRPIPSRARSLTPSSNRPTGNSTRSSSGPRRRISNVERKECIATIKECFCDARIISIAGPSPRKDSG